MQKEDLEIYNLIKEKNHIIIANKCDLVFQKEKSNLVFDNKINYFIY